MRSGDCGHVLHNLKIAHTDCTHMLYNFQIVHTCYTISRVISRLPVQSRDSENAQHNLEIAQILRLHGTYMCLLVHGGTMYSTCLSVEDTARG